MWDKAVSPPPPLSHLPPVQNNTCSQTAGLSSVIGPGFRTDTVCCTKFYMNGSLGPSLQTPVEESPLLPPRLQISVMKIRVGRRLPKIRVLISAPRRICRLIGSLVRKISALMSQNQIPRNSSTLPLRPRTRDSGSIARRRKMVPKGCVAVYVGEERQRFVIPIIYLSHPFITKLLAKEEPEGQMAYTYGGPLTTPCDVGDFEQVKWLIDRETNAVSQVI